MNDSHLLYALMEQAFNGSCSHFPCELIVTMNALMAPLVAI